MLALAVGAVIAGGYLAQRLARPANVPSLADSVSLPSPRLTPPAALPMPRSEPTAEVVARESKSQTSAPAPPEKPRSEPTAEVVAREAKLPTSAPAPSAKPRPATGANPGRLAQKRVVEALPVPRAPVVARFGSATEPPAPAATPEAVQPVTEAPPPDRWQVMADTIARCGRDGFFAGVICEQRVRLQYCEGYWGQAAQCPSGINNDHGR